MAWRRRVPVARPVRAEGQVGVGARLPEPVRVEAQAVVVVAQQPALEVVAEVPLRLAVELGAVALRARQRALVGQLWQRPLERVQAVVRQRASVDRPWPQRRAQVAVAALWQLPVL